jgi:hypothetical protein
MKTISLRNSSFGALTLGRPKGGGGVPQQFIFPLILIVALSKVLFFIYCPDCVKKSNHLKLYFSR